MRKDMELLEERMELMADVMKKGEATLDQLRVERDERCRQVSTVCVCLFVCVCL